MAKAKQKPKKRPRPSKGGAKPKSRLSAAVKAKTKPGKGKQKQSKPEPRMVWKRPVIEKGDKLAWEVWRTQDKKYSVVRTLQTAPGHFAKVRFGCGYRNKTIDNHYTTLAKALKACENHYITTNSIDIDKFESNRDKILKTELKWMPPVEEQTELSNWWIWRTSCGRYEVGRCVAKSKLGYTYFVGRVGGLKQEDFTGLDGAMAWCEKLHCQAVDLNPKELVSNKGKVIDAAIAKDLHRLPVEVGVVEKVTVGPTGELVKKSVVTKIRGSGPKDEFGCRPGSGEAQAVAALVKSGDWMSMKEIQEATGLTNTYYNLFKKLCDKKLLEKMANKFRVVGKKSKK